MKTLRYYHEQGILVPSRVDHQTGYRYYAESRIETARVIIQLRKLDFTLVDIAKILNCYNEEADILDYLERQKRTIHEKLQAYREISRTLNQIIIEEREARVAMKEATFEVQEKTVDAMVVAGVHMKGRYSDCGKGFAQIGRRFGRHICGKPFLLHYDTEYKEEDAEFDVCMPVRKGISSGEIFVRELAGGPCVSLLHKGPYAELGRSYARILNHVKQQGHQIEMPTREIYVKGPGMIFRGNPVKYLTEIQMLLRE